MEFKKDRLSVRIFSGRQQMGEQAAKDVSACIRELSERKGFVNMVFAAAPSQTEFLRELVEDPDVDWQRVNAFHMDEYAGLGVGMPQSFGTFLRERIFGLVPFRSVFYLDGKASDLAEECRRYASLLEQFPPDIVCLGIGENGHIAFNDPHVADFNDPEKVKVVELDGKCRMQQVHDACFSSLEEVPTHALTLTIPSLLAARYMFCIVPSQTKKMAVYETVNGPVSESCPASILRTKEHAVLYLDPESAELLMQ